MISVWKNTKICNFGCFLGCLVVTLGGLGVALGSLGVPLGGLGVPWGAQARSKNLASRESRPILTPFGTHLGIFFVCVRSIFGAFSQPNFMMIS